MKRIATLTLALAALSLIAISPAQADTRVAELLAPDPNFPAWGLAEAITNPDDDDLLVRLDAAVPNGRMVEVAVILYGATGDDWIPIAKVEVILGSATLSLCSLEDISDAFPLDNVAAIQVQYKGKVILEGWFLR
jgi:hypothetical protein